MSSVNIQGASSGQSQNLNRSNSNERKTLSGGAGKDTLTNWSGGKYSTINGWSGNDSIKNTAANVTINGGADNDTITNSGANVLFNYANGDGNDSISGFNATSTLKIGNGSDTYSTTKSSDGKDIIVTVGNGKITLAGAASLSSVNIQGASSVKELYLRNYVYDTLITGDAGNDNIENYGDNVTISSGVGSDMIINLGNNVSISGGAEDDYILNSFGDNVSISGGTGNDIFWGDDGSETFIYNSGDGKDTIYGFDNTDLLDITRLTGSVTGTLNSNGDEFTIKVGSTAVAVFNLLEREFPRLYRRRDESRFC